SARVRAALALWKVERQAETVLPVIIDTLQGFISRRSQDFAMGYPPYSRPRYYYPPYPANPAGFLMPSLDLCHQMAEVLGEMGSQARAAVRILREVVKGQTLDFCRPYFALALARIDRHEKIVIPALTEFLGRKDYFNGQFNPAMPMLHRQTATALGQL